MQLMPDLEALRALVETAHAGSLNAASRVLGVTQQAVSQRIRALESALGVRLLVRSPRGSALTSAGELVVGWATTLLATAREFSESVASLRAGTGRAVRVAASLTIAEHLVPAWMARWRARNAPAVRISAANSEAVVAAVRAGRADLGFIESTRVPTDLGSVTIAQDEILVVVGRHHPWANLTEVTPEQVSRTPLVLRESGSGTRQALEDALADAGHPIEAEPVAVLSTTLGIRATVKSGQAPGALSALAVAEDLQRGDLVAIRVAGVRIMRPMSAIWVGREPVGSASELLGDIFA